MNQSVQKIYQIPADWQDPVGLCELLEVIKNETEGVNQQRVRYAYFLAEKFHEGQKRASGEPFIIHPLAVALILANLGMDEDTLVAALLHDVLEDCDDAEPEFIIEKFGQETYDLIEGVTKLKFKPLSGAENGAVVESSRAAESMRKMLLAMAKDVRVMLIKLADRLHNMQTLGNLPPHKQTKIANETLDIYAPLASRLGIWNIRWQLEDLSFKYLHPNEFQEITELVSKSRTQREQELEEATKIIQQQLKKRDVEGIDIHGRPKHLYSIFNKIVKFGFEFEQILDLLAIRIVVQDTSDCYIALGIIHDIWVPIPGYFYDYIAKPKSNGYQSLHTKVVGPRGEPIEIQIRTKEMHQVAEYGVAAHWIYKEGKRSFDKDAAKLSNLREQLFDWSNDNRTSSDFLKSVSTDLFSEQVFVFTPKGDVLDLPYESTPIDFAFRLHSELGLMVVGSKVNGIMVPLDTELQNGDVIELITRSNARPSLDWLNFVKSSHARAKLRSYFRKLNKDENAEQGRLALEKELNSLGLDLKEFLNDERLNDVANESYGCQTAADLLARIGEGQVSVQSVVLKLRGRKQEKDLIDTIRVSKTREGKMRLTIDGLANLLVNRARCCDPIPGEDIVGYVSRGRGMVIHRKICPNAIKLAGKEPERLAKLDWPSAEQVYSLSMRIVTVNRQGLLMEISTIFGETKTNVSSARLRTLPNHTAEIDVVIEVKSIEDLNLIMTRISQLPDIISILRVFEGTKNK